MNQKLRKEQINETAKRVYSYMIADHSWEALKLTQKNAVDCHAGNWGMDIHNWDWNPGVGLIAISEYYQKTRQKEVQDFLLQWIEKNEHKSENIKTVNTTGPFTIYPELYESTGDKKFLEKALGQLKWLYEAAVYTKVGAISHTGNYGGSDPSINEQVWADTVFMAVLFMAKLARVTGDRKLAREAVEQLVIHIKMLQEPETGVLYHGYNCMTENHFSGALWARGNSWLAVGIPMILKEVAGLAEAPEELFQKYSKMIKGLAGFQAENGLWHTVVDYPAFYQEASGSAGIGAGMLKAIKAGIIEASYSQNAERALQGIMTKITGDGEVKDVSGGTPIMHTIEEYNGLSCYPTLYGQGLALIFLCECL